MSFRSSSEGSTSHNSEKPGSYLMCQTQTDTAFALHWEEKAGKKEGSKDSTEKASNELILIASRSKSEKESRTLHRKQRLTKNKFEEDKSEKIPSSEGKNTGKAAFPHRKKRASEETVEEHSKKFQAESQKRPSKVKMDENLRLPRIKLHEKENWNFDLYSVDDRSKVLEYIYRSYSGHVSSIDITRSDISRLREGNCLNDALINFYLKHLEQECVQETLKERIFIFSSYFYQKLKQTNAETKDDRITNYMAVSRWTKNVDIFSKDFLIMPICEESHWRLAVICYPRAVFDNAIEFYKSRKSSPTRKTSSLIFLSSTEGEVRITAQVIKSYIETEYFMRKMSEEHRKVFKEYEGYDRLFTVWKPKVPKQENGYDCGVYTLQYAEEILKDPDSIAAQISEGFGSKVEWFKAGSVKNKRKKLQSLFMKYMLKSLGANISLLSQESVWEIKGDEAKVP